MGSESDGTFPAIVEAAASEARGLRVLSVLHRYVGPMSDHAAFAAAGQPFLFLSCGMGTHYHTPRDTMDWINFDKLAHTTRFIEDLVVRIDCTPASASHERFDPFDDSVFRPRTGAQVRAECLDALMMKRIDLGGRHAERPREQRVAVDVDRVGGVVAKLALAVLQRAVGHKVGDVLVQRAAA